MKCVLSLCLLGLLASAVIGQAPNVKKHQKNVQFIPGQVYIYEYNSRLLSGIPQLADQYAGFELQADLVLQPLNEEVVAMKLANIKVGRLNDEVPANQQEDIDLAHHPHTEYQRELTKPIKFFQQNGKIKSFEADASEPQWSLNMKKSILSLLNVNLNPQKIIKSPEANRLNANLIPRQNQQAEELRVYPVYEEGIGGLCETRYVINHVNDRDDQSPEPEFVLNVTKTKNYDNCLTEPTIVNDNYDNRGCPWVCRKQKSFTAVPGYHPTPDEVADPFMQGCPCKGKPSDSPVSQYSHTKYNISTAQPIPIIESIFSEGKVTYETFGDQIVIAVHQNLTLQKMVSSARAAINIQDMPRPVRHNELAFRLPKPQLPQGIKAPLDIPYYHLFGQPNTPELIELVPQLLDSLASDIVAGDISASKESLPKAVQVVNALAVLKEEALEEIFKKVAIPGRSNRATAKEQVIRKLFLDSLPIAGSNDAAMFIKTLIEADQVSTMEAKELVEAVPQNLFLPEAATVDAYLELFQNPKVKSKRHLYASAGIAFGKLVREVVVKREHTPGDLPNGQNVPSDKRDLPAQLVVQPSDPQNPQRAIVQEAIRDARQQNPTMNMRMKRSAPWESAFRQELPSEQDVLKYVQILSKKLQQADEFHKKVTLIETLAHMGVPQVLKVLEPYVSGKIPSAQCPGYETENKEEQQEECNFLRQVAIYALHHVVEYYPKQVLPLVLPVYTNKAEPYELRIAAFTTLLFADPEEHTLEKIATELWHENNKQVSSFVYSALKSAGNFSLPCFEKLSKNADNAFDHAQEAEYGVQYSKFHAHDYYDEERDFGLYTVAEWVANNISRVPRSGYFSVGQSNGPFQDEFLQVGFNAKGVENLIERAFEPNGILSDMFEGMHAKKERRLNKRNTDSAQQALEALKDKLDLEFRTDDEPKATIFFKLFDRTSYYALDKHHIKQLIDEAEDHLKDMAQNLLQGQAAHYVKFLMPSKYVKIVPSEIGLPVVIINRHPLIISLKVDNAKLDLATHPKTIYPTGLNFTALIEPSILYSSYVFAFAVNPANQVAFGAHVEKTTQLTVPMEVSIGYVRPKNLFTASVIPKAPQEVIYHKTQAKTFVAKSAIAKAADQDWLENSKDIKTMPVPFKTEERVGQDKLGLGLRIEVESEDPWTDKPFWSSKTAKKHGIIPALVEEIRNPGWEAREVHVELEPDREEPTYGYDFTLRYKWVADENEGADKDDSDESSASSESDSDESDESSSSKSSESASSESDSKNSKSSESSSSESSESVSTSLKKKIKARLQKLVKSKESKESDSKSKSDSSSSESDESKNKSNKSKSNKSKSSSESSSESNESGSSESASSKSESKSDRKNSSASSKSSSESSEESKSSKSSKSSESKSSTSASSSESDSQTKESGSSESSSSSSSGSDESSSMEDNVFDYEDVMELILGQDFKKHSIKKIARELVHQTKDAWQWAWDDDEDSSSSDSSRQNEDIVPATISHDIAITAVARGPRPTYYAVNILYVHTYDHRTIWVKADGHIKTPRGVYVNVPTLFCADAVLAYPALPGEFYYDPTSMQTAKAKLQAQLGWGAQCRGDGGIIITGVMEKTEDQVIKPEDLASPKDGSSVLHLKDWIYNQCQVDRSEGKPLSWACERAIIEESYLNQIILDIKYKHLPHEIKNISQKLDMALKVAMYESMDNNAIGVDNPDDQIRVIAQYSSRVPGVPLVNLRIEKPHEETQFEKIFAPFVRPISTLLPTKEVYANLLTGYENTDSCALMEDFVRTFDNVTYKLPDNPCHYLVAKDCSPKERFAVFATQLDEESKTKKVTVLVAGSEIILTPPTQQDLLQVVVDGKPKELTFKNPITYNREKEDIRIYLRKTVSDAVNPIAVVEVDQDGVQILYDGKNAKVLVDSRHKGKLCGLCGDNNDETEEEFQGPDECQYEDAEDFANSYALAGEHCEQIPKPRGHFKCEKKDSSEESKERKKIPKDERTDVRHKTRIYKNSGPSGTTTVVRKETVYGSETASITDKRENDKRDNARKLVQQILRTQYIIKDGNACFTTRPVMTCITGRPTSTKTITLDFHCLPAESPFTKQLMVESERKYLSQLANKRVDFREQVIVPIACAQ